ncbi:DUF2064 domain-containing protein [Glaciihabitans sp. dw_435]|uniref:TIGR04282 family arsenosugar biosynthesis glycosyltransferase n=1 Tax=Glaciihabitans sp. dw_435 TaxID=2720081 RepID=UPI001BD37274|nr:DUF2064 domain-containing protein [Glaciihabitans sp. dw_435]
MTTLVIIAKETIAGKVKTRLHPPLSLEQAAEVAAASLADTFDAVAAVPATRRILFFDGFRLPPGARGYEVVHQPSGTLDERLGAIFDTCDGPTVLIGMDTPQVSSAHLAPAFQRWPDDIDAWFGPATDGGFWALGMAEPRGDLIRGVEMSKASTGRDQLARLTGAGLRVGMLPWLTDMDTIGDAEDIAAEQPFGRVASTLASFSAISAPRLSA